MLGLEKQTSEVGLHPPGATESKKALCCLYHQRVELRSGGFLFRRQNGDQGTDVKSLSSE